MFDVAVAGKAATSTPGWLLRAAGLIVALAILSSLAVLWAAGSIGDTARTIGRDAEPSVALALRMTATLADMNAAAMSDSLTDNGAAAGTSRAFRDDSFQLSGDLVEAARNITYGAAEAAPLRDLQQALLNYQEAVVESRYVGAGNAWVTSRRVQWASRVNREFAAPAATALAAANASALEERWAAYQRTWVFGALAGLVTLGAMLAVLVLVQAWLLRRMHRVVNPPLAAGTVVCAAAMLWFGSQTIAAHGQLRAAKQDAYDSLHVLFEAKAEVNAVRADMSLWLLDPTVRAEAQGRIAEAEQSLIGDASHDPNQARMLVGALQSALRIERGGDAAGAMSQVPKTGGLLGAELANVTFGVPERAAATDAVVRLLEADAELRTVQALAVRDRTGAVARWLDERSGSAAVFAAEQAALDRTTAVNQAAFEQDTAAVLSGARLIAPLTLGALALAALLSVVGVWLRLREYR